MHVKRRGRRPNLFVTANIEARRINSIVKEYRFDCLRIAVEIEDNWLVVSKHLVKELLVGNAAQRTKTNSSQTRNVNAANFSVRAMRFDNINSCHSFFGRIIAASGHN